MRPPRTLNCAVCVLCWLVALQLAVPVGAEETLRTVEWPFQHVFDVAVQGSFAYVGGEHEFLVVDVSNPEAPTRAGRIELPEDSLTAVAAAGSYVLAGNEYGDALLVIDVTDPGSPRTASRMEDWNNVQDIAVAGDVAFIVDYDGMTPVDISDPANPVRFSDPVSDRVKHIDISSGLAYVTDFNGGLRIYDISDPASPEYLGRFPEGHRAGASGVAVTGDLAVVVWPGGLETVDVSDPGGPVGLGFSGRLSAKPGIHGHVRLVGEHAVVLGKAGASIVDLSDPAAPFEVGVFSMRSDTPWWTFDADLDVSGTLAFIAGGSNAPVVVDISEPEKPRRVGLHSDSLGWGRGAAVSGGHAYVATTSNFLTIDVVGADAPRLIGSVPLPGEAYHVAVQNDHAYVTLDWIGLRVVDVGDPSQPVIVGGLDLPPGHFHLAVSGSVASIATGSSLRVLDISDPAKPAQINAVQLPAIDTAIDGNTLVVLSDHTDQNGDRYSTLSTFDLTDPQDPIPLGSLDHCNSAALAVSGGRAYVEGSCGLHVIDIADPTVPARVASTSGGLIYDSLVVTGQFIYLPVFVDPHPDSMRDYFWTKPETHCFDVADPSDPMPTGLIYPPTVRAASPGYLYGTTDNTFWMTRTHDPLNDRWVSGVAIDPGRKTDLVVLNRSSTDTEILATLSTSYGFAEGKNVIPAMNQRVFEIEGMAGPERAGTVRVKSTQPIIANGHIVKTQKGNGSFTTGRPGWHRTGVPRFYPDPTDWWNGTGWLLGLRQLDGRYSTNLLLTNPEPAADTAAVDITLYATDGTELTSYTVEVKGGTTFVDPEPLTRRAGRPDLGWGYARIDGRVLASATVVDLRTEDAMTVQVTREWGRCVGDDRNRQRLWFELAAHKEGRRDSSWRTDLVALNLSEDEGGVELKFHGPDGVSSLTTTISGSNQAIFQDIVGLLDSHGKGLLEIRSDQPLAVSGRVYNASGGGTAGHALQGRGAYAGLITGEVAWLAGLRQTKGAYRTNINVSNIGDSPATVRIALFTTTGVQIAEYTRTVAPKRVYQDIEPFAKRGGQENLGWGFARVTVEKGRGVFVSGSVINSHTKDSIMVPMER